MKATLIGMALAAYCAFWFLLAHRTAVPGDPTWLPFAVLLLLLVPALLGIGIGRAVGQDRRP